MVSATRVASPPVTEAESEAARDALGGRGRYRESGVLTQVYERCREVFLVAQAAFGQARESMATGRFEATEQDELVRRVGDFQQWAQLALRIADREVEEFARERAALRPKLTLRPPTGAAVALSRALRHAQSE